jgi:hypothetical protein
VRDLSGATDQRFVRRNVKWLAPALVAGLVIGLGFACGGGGGFVDAPVIEPPPDPGTFAVDWSLKHASGSAATCMDAGATLFVANLKDQANGESSAASFNCELGGAISGALTPGTYDIGFTLAGSAGVITMGMMQMGVVIQSDTTTRILPVVFDVP